MNILVALEDLRIGGAQTFGLRLAQALYESGHRVFLYDMYWQYTEHDMVKRLAPNVELLEYKPKFSALDMLLTRVQGWLQRRGLRAELRSNALRQHLRQIIQEKQIDVISSNGFKADNICAQALSGFPLVPLVVTMHGDYEQFLDFFRKGKEYVIPGYMSRLTETVKRLTGVAYLSDQNLQALQPQVAGMATDHVQVRRIYNGLDGRFSGEVTNFNRAALRIPEEALVFGMVARGVPEKGWQPVIEAYKRLQKESVRPIHLILVGASPFLTQLRDKYQVDLNLHFLGFVDNPVDCIASFDVGILASSLKESLPNAIAEYLFCNKGVISTDVGEIRQMICTEDGQEAGLLIDFPSQGLADTEQLYQAMKRYAEDEVLMRHHQALAPQAFVKFEMSRCVKSYIKLYEDCAKNLSA